MAEITFDMVVVNSRWLSRKSEQIFKPNLSPHIDTEYMGCSIITRPFYSFISKQLSVKTITPFSKALTPKTVSLVLSASMTPSEGKNRVSKVLTNPCLSFQKHMPALEQRKRLIIDM